MSEGAADSSNGWASRIAKAEAARAARADAVRGARRRYSDRNPDHRKASAKRYRELHPDRVAAYRQRYNAENREEVLAKKREYARQKYREQKLRDKRRVYSARYYVNNRDRYIENQKQSIARRRARDPEGFAELQRARDRRWWARHKDAENAKRRDAYRYDAESQRRRAADYYAAHAEEIKAKRRASYAANRDKERAAQQADRDRQRRRKEAGLPPPNVRRTSSDERRDHKNAADAFFTRTRRHEEMLIMRMDYPTEPELLAAWKRDCLRARAAHHHATHPEVAERRAQERARRAPSPDEIAELRRMDAIAQTINDRLRTRETRRPTRDRDAAAPHPMLGQPSGKGMSR